MSIYVPTPLYPRGGNLFGLPEPIDDEFNKVLASNVWLVNNPPAGTTSFPITFPYNEHSEIEVIFKSSKRLESGTAAGNVVPVEFSFNVTPDGIGGYSTLSGPLATPTNNSVVVAYNPVTKTIDIYPSDVSSTNSTSLYGTLTILRRRRKVKSYATFPAGLVGNQILPFAINNPAKTYLGATTFNAGTTKQRQGGFVYNYLPFTVNDIASHMSDSRNGTAGAFNHWIRIADPTTVTIGNGVSIGGFFVLEYL